MKRIGLLSVAGVIGLAAAGCNRNPVQVSQQTLESNPAALEAAMKACSPDTRNAAPRSSSDCQHVAYAAYTLGSQYAAGIGAEGTASTQLMTKYAMGVQLPSSNAEAGLPAPTDLGAGKYVGSVTVGPKPGLTTVKWSGGALTGKVLVLTPRLPDGSHTQLCWNVDAAATTVPEMVRKMSPMIVGGCN